MVWQSDRSDKSDRLANISYSFTHGNDANIHMKSVYQKELPHFLDAITISTEDIRFTLPKGMIERILQLVNAE